MNLWRCLLLVYPNIDVRLPNRFGWPNRFAHAMPGAEIEEALESFRGFPGLVRELTEGRAGIEYDVVHSARALSTLSALSASGSWWPSPTDTAQELHGRAVDGRYDSLFVLWPQNDWQEERSVPSGGWGLGMGASAWSWGATYATVANARSFAWQIPRAGEVWLHEWLHGVCAHFAAQGHPMPEGDADGADRHSYVRSSETGWTGYYRDLMSGNVAEEGRRKGIPLAAWSEGRATTEG